MPSQRTTVSTFCKHCSGHYDRTSKSVTVGQISSYSGELVTGVFSVCPRDYTLNVITHADSVILKSGETVVSILIEEGAQDLRGITFGSTGLICSTDDAKFNAIVDAVREEVELAPATVA